MKAQEFSKQPTFKKNTIKPGKKVHIASKKLVEEDPKIEQKFSVAGISFTPGSHIHRHMQRNTATWHKMKNWD
jgi:hypothetical protein